MNTPVNFEIAKLLKDSGFDKISCSGYYHICEGYTKGYAHCYSDVNTQKENVVLAPTIAEVVMWLYEKHGIWIEVKSPDYKDMDWYFSIHKPYKFGNHYNGEKIYYPSPTEAYEAAIKYTLENLI